MVLLLYKFLKTENKRLESIIKQFGLANNDASDSIQSSSYNLFPKATLLIYDQKQNCQTETQYYSTYI